MPERALGLSGGAPGAAFDVLATTYLSPTVRRPEIVMRKPSRFVAQPWEEDADDEWLWLDELECMRASCADVIRTNARIIERMEELESRRTREMAPAAPRIPVKSDPRRVDTGVSLPELREWWEERRAELPRIENQIFDEVNALWKSLFPGEDLYDGRAANRRSSQAQVGGGEVGMPDCEPIADLFTRCWEEISGYGLGRISASLGGDVFVAMRGSLGIGGMTKLLRALRRGDKSDADRVFARTTAYAKRHSRDWHSRVRTVRLTDGRLRIVVDQLLARAGPGCLGRVRGHEGFRQSRRSVRPRSSRGRGVRSVGSRRCAGRAGNGSSDEGGDGPGFQAVVEATAGGGLGV